MATKASKDNTLPIVTCDQVYYAIKTASGYETPVCLEHLTEIGIEKNFNTEPFYAGGVLAHQESTLSDIPVTLSIGDLTDVDECELLGHQTDNNGMVIRSIHDLAPDVALMFTVKKAAGVYKGYVFYDGKFVPSGVSAATSEGSPNYQPKTITGMFKADGEGVTDSSKVMTTAAEVQAFFTSVPMPDFTTPAVQASEVKQSKK